MLCLPLSLSPQLPSLARPSLSLSRPLRSLRLFGREGVLRACATLCGTWLAVSVVARSCRCSCSRRRRRRRGGARSSAFVAYVSSTFVVAPYEALFVFACVCVPCVCRGIIGAGGHVSGWLRILCVFRARRCKASLYVEGGAPPASLTPLRPPITGRIKVASLSLALPPLPPLPPPLRYGKINVFDASNGALDRRRSRRPSAEQQGAIGRRRRREPTASRQRLGHGTRQCLTRTGTTCPCHRRRRRRCRNPSPTPVNHRMVR